MTTGNNVHKHMIIANTVHKPMITCNNVHKHMITGNTVHKPIITGNTVHKPMITGNNVHKHMITGNTVHKPMTTGNTVHKPIITGNTVHKHMIIGNNVHKPMITGNNVHKPMITGNIVILYTIPYLLIRALRFMQSSKTIFRHKSHMFNFAYHFPSLQECHEKDDSSNLYKTYVVTKMKVLPMRHTGVDINCDITLMQRIASGDTCNNSLSFEIASANIYFTFAL